MSQTIAVWEKVAARPSRIACATVPRMATMKAAIIVLEWPGSRPCSAPRRIALGAKSHALPVPTLRISVRLDMWAWRLFARSIRRLMADRQEPFDAAPHFFGPKRAPLSLRARREQAACGQMRRRDSGPWRSHASVLESSHALKDRRRSDERRNMAEFESREGPEPLKSGKQADEGDREGSHVESTEQRETRARSAGEERRQGRDEADRSRNPIAHRHGARRRLALWRLRRLHEPAGSAACHRRPVPVDDTKRPELLREGHARPALSRVLRLHELSRHLSHDSLRNVRDHAGSGSRREGWRPFRHGGS